MKKPTKVRAKKDTGEGPIKAPELPTSDNVYVITTSRYDNIELMAAEIAGGLIAGAKLPGDQRDEAELSRIAATAVDLALKINRLLGTAK